MRPYPSVPTTAVTKTRAGLAAGATCLLTTGFVLLAGGAQAAPTAVLLGAADSFVVLAGAGITNTGPTTLNGDIGTYPTTSISGDSSMTINGANHVGNAVTQNAKSDLVTAYNNAAGQGPPSPIAVDLGGQTLTSGVYNSASSIGLTGALTLNAQGDPDAVFVFQAGSTLTTATASSVVLANGAQACNVYWQIGSSATLGTATAFRGTILALTDITLTTGATVEGRVLARNGAVTLDTNTITRPTCVTGPGGGPTTPAPSTAGPGGPGGPDGTGGPDGPDDTSGTDDSDGSGGPGGPGGPGTGTGDQVSTTPGGGVDTGSSGPGTTAEPPSRWWLAGFVMTGAGAAAVAVGWRRRRTA